MTGRQAAALAAAVTALAGAFAGAMLRKRSADRTPGRARPERDDVHHPV